MLLNPEPEQIMFAGRNQFDIVVYYDQNSQSEHLVLNHLREAIYIHEYGKLLQRPPVMLAGGFEAWKQMIGDRGIYKYNNDSPVERSNQRVPHWLQDVVGKGSEQSTHFSPVKVHNTIYDYVSDKHRQQQETHKYNSLAILDQVTLPRNL
jgi:ubiquitin carboxyl-terminal hydrolase 8